MKKAFRVKGLDDIKPHLKSAKDKDEALEIARMVAGFGGIGVCSGCHSYANIPKESFSCEEKKEGGYLKLKASGMKEIEVTISGSLNLIKMVN